MLVALTLCPMMASRILKEHDADAAPSRNPLMRGLEAVGSGAERLYHRMLDAALAAPAVVLAISFLFAGAAAVAYTMLPEKLTPTEDRGVIPISVSGPQGVDVEYMDAQMRQVEAIVAPLVESGEVINTYLIAGGFDREFRLHHADARAAGASASARSRRSPTRSGRKLEAIPGVEMFLRQGNSLGIRGGGQGLRFAITGTDYDELAVKAEEMQARAGGAPGLRPRHASTTTPPSRSSTSPSTARRPPTSASPWRRSGRRSPPFSMGARWANITSTATPYRCAPRRPTARSTIPATSKASTARGGRPHGAALLLRHHGGAGGGAGASPRGPAPRRADQRHARARRRPPPGNGGAGDAWRRSCCRPPWASTIWARRRR